MIPRQEKKPRVCHGRGERRWGHGKGARHLTGAPSDRKGQSGRGTAQVKTGPKGCREKNRLDMAEAGCTPYVTLQNLCQADGWGWRADCRQRTRGEDGRLAETRSQRVSTGVQANAFFSTSSCPTGQVKCS